MKQLVYILSAILMASLLLSSGYGEVTVGTRATATFAVH